MANHTVPFTGGMKIGLGYDRLTGDRLPTPSVQERQLRRCRVAVVSRLRSIA